MAVEIKLPVLGDGVDSGDVLEVLVNEGEMIAKDQGIVELETDKATVTVPSSHAGKITKIMVKEGDTVNVGGVILMVEAEGAPTASESTPATPAAATTSPAAQPGPSNYSPPATAPISESKPELESQAERPAAEYTPPAEPVVSAPELKPQPALVPQAPLEPLEPIPPQPTLPTLAPSPAATGGEVAAGPAIRRFAREVGVDLTTIHGSGEHGRIVRDDVLKVVRNQPNTVPSAGNSGQRDDWGPIHIEKMPKIRQTIARKMHESWSTAPRVTNFDDADVTDLENIRQSSKDQYKNEGIRLTSMPFVIKAVAMALKAHPVINASVNLDQGQIVYKNYINVGIAVDTERGLVVPSLRSADQLAIPQIARQLSEMAENVRDNKFSIEDLRGGTFTISNLGAIGGTYSTPIINVPETAILLVGRSRKMPVVVNDEIKVRLMMPLSLSYDHRLIDGGAAARFLNEVIEYLEQPSRLLLAL